jgi:hypothetical protein
MFKIVRHFPKVVRTSKGVRLAISTLYSNNSFITMHGNNLIPVAYVCLSFLGLRRLNSWQF